MKIDAYSTDAEIRRYLALRKRRRVQIRVASRLGVLVVIFLLMIYLIVTGIQHLLISDSHAEDKHAKTTYTEEADTEDDEPKSEYEKIIAGLEEEEENHSPEEPRGVIFVDAGHGGDDPGAEWKGRVEKEETLAMALAVRKYLHEEGFKVVMSRTDDSSVDRKKRALMANKCGADLMVSIHRNKSEKKGGYGWEMYIPSADREADRMLGETIMGQLKGVGITDDRGVRAGTLPDPKDDYSENKYSKMPSVLIECGFMNSKEDNELFDDNLAEYAEAIAHGVAITFETLYEIEK